MYLLNTKCKVSAAYFIERTLRIVYRLNLTCVVPIPFQRSDKCLYCIKLGPNIISETCSGSTCIEAEVYGKPDSRGSSTEKLSYHWSHITAWLPVDEPIQWRRPYCLPSIPQQLAWRGEYFFQNISRRSMLLSKRNCIDLSGVGMSDRGSLMTNQQKNLEILAASLFPVVQTCKKCINWPRKNQNTRNA